MTHLTATEQRIVQIVLADNASSRLSAANAMGVNISTIRVHLRNIYKKYNVHSLDELKRSLGVAQLATRVCARCKCQRSLSEFTPIARGISRLCIHCKGKRESLTKRIFETLQEHKQATAYAIARLLDEERHAVYEILRNQPTLFRMVGATDDKTERGTVLWSVADKPKAIDAPDGLVAWWHSSPVACWQLSGIVLAKAGDRVWIKANGCNFEVLAEQLRPLIHTATGVLSESPNQVASVNSGGK
jgi:DNA-binding CsgD family transcriptional regulator